MRGDSLIFHTLNIFTIEFLNHDLLHLGFYLEIGCFVSIVSTKIPFKGTGKEYIGDDITEIQTSVKRALQSCCQQLRSHLTKRNAMRDANQRKSRLVKYIPDATRSIIGILEEMKKRKLESGDDDDEGSSPRKIPRSVRETQRIEKECSSIIQQLDDKEITEKIISDSLVEAIETHGASAEGASASSGDNKNGKGSDSENAHPVYLVPMKKLEDASHDIHHGLFTFRPMNPMAMAMLK